MRGFTLIETIVMIAVFALALGAVSGSLVLIYRTQNFTFEQSQAIAEAQKGVESMAKEIREARTGQDGSYLIERADDYELVFFSDIDKDNEVERVRYFINPAGGAAGSESDTCVSFTDGGSCSVTFTNFAGAAITSSSIEVSVEGDLNSGSERVDIFIDGVAADTLCSGGACGQCVGEYEDLTSFDVTTQAADNVLEVLVDATSSVDDICDWEEPNHSLKALVLLEWTEAAPVQEQTVFKKGVTQPFGWPVTYPSEQEVVVAISENVTNEARGLPVFTYYDESNNLLSDPASRLEDTTRMHLELIVNVNPNRAPQDFSLQTDVQLRNLKTNL